MRREWTENRRLKPPSQTAMPPARLSRMIFRRQQSGGDETEGGGRGGEGPAFRPLDSYLYLSLSVLPANDLFLGLAELFGIRVDRSSVS